MGNFTIQFWGMKGVLSPRGWGRGARAYLSIAPCPKQGFLEDKSWSRIWRILALREIFVMLFISTKF